MNRSTRLLLTLFVLLALPATAATEGGDQASTENATRTATFSMYCYWTGEAALGRVDGVVASRIGHWGGDEVVQVDYDPARTDVETLVEALEGARSFDAILVAEDNVAGAGVDLSKRTPVIERRGAPRFIEPKHSLRVRHPELLALGLSERQAIALNVWSHYGGPMPDVLSDEQKRMLAAAEER